MMDDDGIVILGGLVTVIVIIIFIVVSVKADNSFREECAAKGGHVDTQHTTGFDSDGNVTYSSNNYCLSDSGGVLMVQ